MNPIRWHKPKWLPRLLAMPVPEPSQQAAQILEIQRNIVLPAKLMFTVVVLYYLFDSGMLDVSTSPTPGAPVPSPRGVALEFLRNFFIFYIIFNAVAAILLVLRRFPHKLVPWVVFTVGLVDGLLVAGLTVETGGFGSNLYWIFPGLIFINALTIPLAAPQIVLNLSLCSFYLGAGVLNISLGESDLSLGPNPQHLPHWILTASNVLDLESFTARLKLTNDPYRFFDQQLSPETRDLLSDYHGGTNELLREHLAQDLNHLMGGGSIYDSNRFASVRLSADTSNLLVQSRAATNVPRSLNRSLLLDAFPDQISRTHRSEFMNGTPSLPEEPMTTGTDAEFFILRLIILLSMTASCYGVQLLSFRQKLSDEETRKSAARNDELRAAGRLAAEIAHQLKNPLGIINNAAYSLQRARQGGPERLQSPNPDHPRGSRTLRPHHHPTDGLRPAGRRPRRKTGPRRRNSNTPSQVFPPGGQYRHPSPPRIMTPTCPAS